MEEMNWVWRLRILRCKLFGTHWWLPSHLINITAKSADIVPPQCYWCGKQFGKVTTVSLEVEDK